MSESIGPKIEVTGEREFKSAISGINAQMRVFGSEMKMTTSAFGNNADSMEALTAKNKVLNEQIEVQKTKVETLKQALSYANDTYGETDKRTLAWQTSLNNAQAELNDMQNNLDKNNKALDEDSEALDDASKKSDKFGKAVDDAAKEADNGKGKFESLKRTVKNVSVAIAGAVTAIGASAVACGKKLVDMANDTAAAGDKVDKGSQAIGMSNKAYQEWAYVLGQNGASIDSMGTALNKLNNTVDDAKNGTSSAVEKFSRLGISISELEGKSREDIFGMVVSGLQGVEDESLKATLANDLLGKASVSMGALLNQTADSTDDLKNRAHELGLVMSDEAVNASVNYGDALDDLKLSFAGAKNGIMGDLLPSITNIVSGLTGLITGQEDANETLKAGVDGIVTKFGEALPKLVTLLSTLAQSVLEVAPQIITTLISGITDNLPLLIESGTKIIMTLVGALIDALPDIVESALQLVLSLSMGIADALPELVPTIVTVITTIVTTLIENLPMLLDAGLQLLVGLATGIVNAIPRLIAELPMIITAIVDSLVGMLDRINDCGDSLNGGLIAGIIDAIPKLMVQLPRIITAIVTTLTENLPKIIKMGMKLLVNLTTGIIDALPKLIVQIPKIIKTIVKTLTENLPKILAMGVKLVIEIGKGLIDGIPKLVKSIPKIIKAIVRGFREFAKDMGEVGLNLIKGIGDGIMNGVAWIGDKVKSAGNAIVGGFKKVFGIHSPSKIMQDEVGTYLAQGLGIGFTDEMKSITDDMTKSIPTDFEIDYDIARNINTDYSTYNGRLNAGIDYDRLCDIFMQVMGKLNLNVVMNDDVIGRIADSRIMEVLA